MKKTPYQIFSDSELNIKNTPIILAGIMVIIVSMVSVVTVSSLYNASFEQQRMRLTELVKNQVGIIEAIAVHENINGQGNDSEYAKQTTLSQLTLAHDDYDGFGETGEFVLAKKEGNEIVFLLSHRHRTSNNVARISIMSNHAEPMQRALSGESGSMIGRDYRGELVLAAYESPKFVGWGVVAKIDLSEIREPFIKAVALSICSALILVLVGTMLFIRFAGNIVHKLEVSEALHKGILSGAVDAIVTIDDGGEVLSFNPAAQRIFGYDSQEIIGGEVDKLISCRKCDECNINVSNCEKENRYFEIGKTHVVDGVDKYGRIIPIEMTSSEIFIGQHKVYTWVLRDISKRKRVEQELEKYQEDLEKLVLERTEELEQAMQKLESTQTQLIQTEKLASIGQLAAGVAHEINNPVGYISSNLNSLEQYMGDVFELIGMYQGLLEANLSVKEIDSLKSFEKSIDYEFLKPDVVDLIGESIEGVTRVKKIILDLKDFSREGQQDWEEANLHDGIESTLNIVHNQLKYKAQIIKEFGDIPLVECIPAKLNQVFMNLLINAGHAIEENGIVIIRTGANDHDVWVEIEDNGSGIPKSKLKQIFDPFYTTKPVGQGTGLGLSLSYGIMKKHNGRIDVKSEEGKGTLFHISLPIHRQAAAA